ncbi:MAG TPA: hypothetical protein VEG35_03765, partial [Burkholderiales bacterium]|nr:hypothetical protein [Burkholderiales bacterium]
MSPVEFDFLIDGLPRRVTVEPGPGTATFRIGADVLEAEVRRISEHEFAFNLSGRLFRVHLVRDGSRVLVSVDGREFVVTEPPSATARTLEGEGRTAEGSLRVRSPMPGRVIK